MQTPSLASEPEQQPPGVEALAPRCEREPPAVQMDQHGPAAATGPGLVEVEAVAANGITVAEIGDTSHPGMEQRQRREQDPSPWRVCRDRRGSSRVSPVRPEVPLQRLFDRRRRAQAPAHENGNAHERRHSETERDPQLRPVKAPQQCRGEDPVERQERRLVRDRAEQPCGYPQQPRARRRPQRHRHREGRHPHRDQETRWHCGPPNEHPRAPLNDPWLPRPLLVIVLPVTSVRARWENL